MQKDKHLVIGVGEVGEALLTLLEPLNIELFEIDLNSFYMFPPQDKVDFMHICFPNDNKFIKAVIKYAKKYAKEEAIIIVHSTVKPFTTETLQFELTNPIVYSPIRGMHPNMTNGMIKFEKFFSVLNPTHLEKVEKLFRQMRLKPVGKIQKARSLEFAKLVNTNYYFLIIAFWEEVLILCQKYDLDLDTIRDFITTTAEKNQDRIILPYVQAVGNKPGDHCLEPNARILSAYSDLPKMILTINKRFKKLFGEKRIDI